MEHLLATFLKSIILGLDRGTQKTLRDLVPNQETLYRDPCSFLAERPLIIGPARRYGTRGFVGLFVGTVALLAAYGLLAAFQVDEEYYFIVLLCTFLGSATAVWWFARGGHCMLTAGEVVFFYHGEAVCCPWALFNARSNPFVAGEWGPLIVPVCSQAVHLIRRNAAFLSPGHCRISSEQLVLKPVYELGPQELGFLLLQLGRSIGSSVSEPSPESNLPSHLDSRPSRLRDGWLTLGVTRLTFPPFCCDCGSACHNLEKLKARHGEHEILLFIPCCRSCQVRQRKRTALLAVVIAFLGTAGSILLLSILLARIVLDAELLLSCCVLPLVAAVIIYQVRHRLVKIRYYPGKGTVAIRFPNPRYAELVVALQEEEDRQRALTPP